MGLVAVIVLVTGRNIHTRKGTSSPFSGKKAFASLFSTNSLEAEPL